MKPSPVMIMKAASLAELPDAQKNFLRHVLLDCIGGVNEEHHRRWKRFVGKLLRAEPGEVIQFLKLEERDLRFHKMHMAFEQSLFDRQERYPHIERFRDWLKTGAAHGRFDRDTHGRMRFFPASEAWEACSEDEIRAVHARMVDFMHTAKAQRRLWPHLSAEQRDEMVDTCLRRGAEEAH